MDLDALYSQYVDLQKYVALTQDDIERVRAAGPLVRPRLAELVDDFYAEIKRHPEALKVIRGGDEQIARLKQSLTAWLEELFSGNYDRDYVQRRWRVGFRHVEIGLDQFYTNVALARLRGGLTRILAEDWQAAPRELLATLASLDKLLDLDLAIIEHAYQSEHLKRIQESERLATLGQVSGGIAHELRNPLNVMKTSIYYLTKARSASPEKQAEHLERIHRQVGVADSVITALSDFAKLPIPNLEPVSLAECISQVLDNVTLPATISVALQIDEDFPQVLADPAQLSIVLANLIRNARDAMPDGGTLTITGNRQGDGVDVVVRDTGCGIAEDALVRIMEPLYSTKARGMGLGLTITRAIIEKHEGAIRVESQLGRGTAFTVHLAAAE